MKEYNIKECDNDNVTKLTESEVAYSLINKSLDSNSILALKEDSGLSNELLSGILHMTPKTLRSYMSKKVTLAENIGEQVLLLTSLFKTGVKMFGTANQFEQWLTRENLMLDGLRPVDLLGTVSGIRLIESRLINIEYGDNA